MAKGKHYQRTLEEALAGVPARQYKQNFTQEPILDENGKRLYAPYQHKKRCKTQETWMCWATNPNHPKYTPELAKKHFLGLARGARNGAKTRRSTPKGWRAKEWKPIFQERINKAMEIVDLAIAQDIFDLPADEADKKAAREALGFEVAIMRSDELPFNARQDAAKTILNFTKAKPAAKLDVAVSTAEDILGKVADKNGL